MNKVIMMGRLTKDPEVRYYGADNKALANFSLAVDRRFKKQGQPEADFFNCTAFAKTAEFVEKYLHKGTKIVLDGELQNNNYTDKNGNKQYAVQIVVNSLEFAESKGSQQDSQNENKNETPSQPAQEQAPESLPFN